MSFDILLIDGPRSGARLIDNGVDDRPPDALVFSIDGVDYRYTGTYEVDIGHRPDVIMWHATKDPVELFQWWRKLSRSTKIQLSDDPWGPVPGDLIPEVTHAGQTVIGAYWADTESGPDGMALSQAVQQWIDDHRVQGNESTRECPECRGTWTGVNFDFNHTDICQMGVADRATVADDLSGRREQRTTTPTEEDLADALGKPPRAAKFRRPEDPIPVSPPLVTTLRRLPGGRLHRIVDGFDPDPLWASFD